MLFHAIMLHARVRILSALVAVLLCSDSFVSAYTVNSKQNENSEPIIGILTQEVSKLVLRNYPGRNLTSYIAASYVKFVEGAGARAVPIWIGESREYYKDILSKVNGVLLPGGATYFNQSGGYADAGAHIYEEALAMNAAGNYFPVWGTCLGFELLTFLSANGTEHRSGCSSLRQPLPLEFVEGFNTSKLFMNAPADVVSILEKYPVTANFHQYCITVETFKKLGLDKEWSVMSLNHDWNGFEFISTIEHKKYPLYGVQFHPEKNLYEFIQNRSIPHSMEAVRAAQYFADFFVSEARKNMNSFTDEEEKQDSLIYNYNPEYTGRIGSSFVQQYLFEGKSEARRDNNNIHLGGKYNVDKPNDLDIGDNEIVLLPNKDELK